MLTLELATDFRVIIGHGGICILRLRLFVAFAPIDVIAIETLQMFNADFGNTA